jgi:hypothetical protein
LDCDPAALGVQDACDVAVSIGHADVDVVFRNGTAAPVDVAAFNFKVRDPDRTRIVPPPGNAQSVDGNPDLNQRAFTPGWACPGPSPLNDTGEDGPGTAVSFIACFAPPELAVTVPAGTELTLATVHYDVPAGAPVGPVTLTPSFVAIFDAAFAELGSCDPIYANPLPCSAAVLTLQPPPPTSTRTPTPTATATATPTPPGAIFSLVPAGNAMNVDSATGAANLWLCAVPALCDGPGEGALDVIAHAANAHTIDADGDEIEDGVASYFIDVLIDTPLADLSACDLAFSPVASARRVDTCARPAALPAVRTLPRSTEPVASPSDLDSNSVATREARHSAQRGSSMRRSCISRRRPPLGRSCTRACKMGLSRQSIARTVACSTPAAGRCSMQVPPVCFRRADRPRSRCGSSRAT